MQKPRSTTFEKQIQILNQTTHLACRPVQQSHLCGIMCQPSMQRYQRLQLPLQLLLHLVQHVTLLAVRAFQPIQHAIDRPCQAGQLAATMFGQPSMQIKRADAFGQSCKAAYRRQDLPRHQPGDERRQHHASQRYAEQHQHVAMHAVDIGLNELRHQQYTPLAVALNDTLAPAHQAIGRALDA